MKLNWASWDFIPSTPNPVRTQAEDMKQSWLKSVCSIKKNKKKIYNFIIDLDKLKQIKNRIQYRQMTHPDQYNHINNQYSLLEAKKEEKRKSPNNLHKNKLTRPFHQQGQIFSPMAAKLNLEYQKTTRLSFSPASSSSSSSSSSSYFLHFYQFHLLSSQTVPFFGRTIHRAWRSQALDQAFSSFWWWRGAECKARRWLIPPLLGGSLWPTDLGHGNGEMPSPIKKMGKNWVETKLQN